MGLATEYRAEARVDIDAKGKKRGRGELETDQRHAFEIWKEVGIWRVHEISETQLLCG